MTLTHPNRDQEDMSNPYTINNHSPGPTAAVDDVWPEKPELDAKADTDADALPPPTPLFDAGPPADHHDQESAGTIQDYRNPDYFPDGGTRAWLALFAGMLVAFATWGIASSFGVFTAYYKESLLPTTSSFRIGWINSVQSAFIFFGGTFSGKIFDAGYFYHLEAAGMVISFVTFMLIAECKEYWQVLLAQGVGLGIGMGLLFSPSLACTGAYFKKYRPMALSVCVGGGGLGGIVFPIVANNLLPKIGFQWTVRVMAFIELALFVIIAGIVRDRIPRSVRQKRLAAKGGTGGFFAFSSWVDTSVFRDPVFMIFVIGMGGCFLCVYVPYAYLQSFASYVNASATVTKYIISILSVFSFFGRISCYSISLVFGPLTSTALILLSSAITLFAWSKAHNESGLLGFSIVYGFLSGYCASTPPFIIPILSPDISRLGVQLGMAFGYLGVAVLLSIPMGGLVLGASYEEFQQLAYFCGGSMMAAGVCLVICRVLRGGFKLKKV